MICVILRDLRDTCIFFPLIARILIPILMVNSIANLERITQSMLCIISVHLRTPAEASAQAGIPLRTFVLKKSVNQYLEYGCWIF